jgi:hypothetical protein
VTLSSILSATVALALLSVPALATPITGILSLDGSDQYSNTLNTITFVGPGSVGGISTGTLSPFTSGNPVTLFNFSFDGAFMPGTEVFTTTEAGVTSTLVLNSLTSFVNVSNGLVINAIGTLSETGYTATQVSYVLTSQDGGQDINVVTFSATATPVGVAPEPYSIALLGTGLLGLAVLVRRRRTVY